MDTLAHGFWGGILSKILNKKFKLKISFWKTFLWSMFPDVFAFALLFGFMIWNALSGNGLPLHKEALSEPTQHDTFPIHQITHILYSISHSLIIFVVFFGVVWLIFKRPLWELTGWLLHILFDIPTHSYSFYPTPFLWPLSDWKFNGISWATPWFMVLNYGALVAVYCILYILRPEKAEQR